MQKDLPVYVAGHRGLVGSALCRALQQRGHKSILTRSRQEVDLCDARAVQEFFASQRPAYVLLAAAKVGGIEANANYPADFIYENLQIQNNVIHAAWSHGVRKLLFLGSSCIYPRLCPQPIREEYLLSGLLEETNRAYALAKIAGLELCRALRQQHGFDAISVMPTNLYGPGDNYHPCNSHVIPAMIRRFHEAKMQQAGHTTIWGTGTVRREFLHVDDMAEACLALMDGYSEADPVNVGCGEDMTIMEVAQLVARVVGYTGHIGVDPTKPDGTPRKVLDVRKLTALGWRPRVGLEQGLAAAYADFLACGAGDMVDGRAQGCCA